MRPFEPLHEKTAFCISENKGADQLHGDSAADQRLSFSFTDSAIPLLPKSEISCKAIFCGCIAWFVWDLVRNHKDRFSSDMAQFEV